MRKGAACFVGMCDSLRIRLPKKHLTSRTRYQQLIDTIKRSVVRGDLVPGDRIPSQRELAQEARVNPNTVQRAYREMEQSGLVQTLRGMGTFIGGNPALLQQLRQEMAAEAVQRFIQDMRALGIDDQQILTLAANGLRGSDSPQKARENHDD